MNSFGARLKKLRQNKGITQKELSRDLGISQSAVAYYENDRNQPDFEMVSKIAIYFSVPVGYLLGEYLEGEIEGADLVALGATDDDELLKVKIKSKYGVSEEEFAEALELARFMRKQKKAGN